MPAKKSAFQLTEAANDQGYATLWLDGNRFDLFLARDGVFSLDLPTLNSVVVAENMNNPSALADKLEEWGATFLDAAKLERKRLAGKRR